MKPEQQIEPRTNDAEQVVDDFLEHLEGVMTSVINLKWDDVNFHLESIDAIAETAPAEAKEVIDAFREPVRGFALGFQELVTGKTADGREKALAYLSSAKNALRKLLTERKEIADNPGFVQFAHSIETQILGVQEKIAREQGDFDRAELLSQQGAQLMAKMKDSLDPNDPMRKYLEAVNLYWSLLPNFSKGMQCLQEMNLDLAQDYLEQSTHGFIQVHDLLTSVQEDALILDAGRNAAEGFGLLVRAQDAYVRTLRTAIIGDVNKSDVDALKQAERNFLDGAERMWKGLSAMPGIGSDFDIRPAAAVLAKMTQNLRTLCERSLSPKQITVTAAPKVVFYFIGTFIVLLIGLPTSGLVAHLGSTTLIFVLIVSLLVSIIGALGFEAIRLVPLLDALSRWLPWDRKSQKGSSKPQTAPAN